MSCRCMRIRGKGGSAEGPSLGVACSDWCVDHKLRAWANNVADHEGLRAALSAASTRSVAHPSEAESRHLGFAVRIRREGFDDSVRVLVDARRTGHVGGWG